MADDARLKELTGMVNELMAAAERGDMEAVKSYYTPDATFWMNATGRTLGLDEQFAMIAAMRGKAKNIRYVDITIIPFENGYVQQHRAVGELPDGGALDIHACFICHMRDGKISRREEYLDSGQIASVRA